MRGHRRKFIPSSFEHVFQHAIDYNILFFSREDRLVFYTIFSVLAWRYGITVLALALMFNHFHTLITAVNSRVRSRFIGTVLATYAMAFNRDSGRKGPIFEKAFGSSPKTTEKAIRTCIAYNYNNSVEKKLFTAAEQDRWNLLAYINENQPFSAPIQRDKTSKYLRLAMKEVDRHVADHAHLSYGIIRRMFRKLSAREKEQLTDYIIARFLPIDKEALLSFYKDYDSMVLAINSNTGSEYEIKEEYTNDSDLVYARMLEIVSHSSFGGNPHTIVAASDEKKKQIAQKLKTMTGAKDYQIARLLHIKPGR